MASKTFTAVIKSVLSGDTLILSSPNNPNLERTFSLAYVSAPRLNKDGDEAFAFQSREFLREACIGKPVQCKILYTIPGSGREFGSAIVKAGPELPDALVKAGWVKVREDAGKKEDDEEALQRLEILRQLESEARSNGSGLWAGTGGHIEVQNDLGGPDFMKQWKGKQVDGVIEKIFSGDRLLVRVLLSEKKHYQLMTLVAGIRTPATQRAGQNGATQPAEEYGNEAKAFVESRLLQRKIKIDIVGASPQGHLVASLIHPRGNIAQFLLEEGLARCNDFHSTMLGEKMAPLRAAETKAQDARLRLHKNRAVKAASEVSSDMTVVKILGADSIIVRSKAGAERRINLSSVRGPRTAEPSEGPFRDEAKEFLRKKIIGKHVQITIDGKKEADGDFEAKEVGTVIQNGKNIGLVLVQEGYASVIRHRKDDTDRAPNYDELLAAQEQAKAEGKGMWSGKPPKVKQYTDASESVQRAKIQLSVLQRQKKVPAIVDFCKSGSRFTILIPRESVKLTLVLGGIRAPRAPGRNPQTDKGEPFGQEALDLANKRCNQRDVEVDVVDLDKVGGFIGDLFVGRESFAKILVEEGLASVHQYSAEKSGNAAELNAAEKRAKEARKGMWHDWDPSLEQDGDEDVAQAATAVENVSIDKKPEDYRDIVVTNIESNGRLKIQEIGKGTAALETMMSEFKKFHNNPTNNVPGGLTNPKAGEYVAAKFSADGQWYRGRIRSNDRTNKVSEIHYIDFGNAEKQPWAKLRPLNQPQFTVQKLKAQATEVALSFIEFPINHPDYMREALEFIADVTEGRQLVACHDFVDAKENLAYVTLFDPKAGGSGGSGSSVNDSLNREVIANGHAMVPRKLKPWERSKVFEKTLDSFREVESKAKQDRMGLWEYGDLSNLD